DPVARRARYMKRRQSNQTPCGATNRNDGELRPGTLLDLPQDTTHIQAASAAHCRCEIPPFCSEPVEFFARHDPGPIGRAKLVPSRIGPTLDGRGFVLIDFHPYLAYRRRFERTLAAFEPYKATARRVR